MVVFTAVLLMGMMVVMMIMTDVILMWMVVVYSCDVDVDGW